MMYFLGGNPHKEFAVVKSERKENSDITIEKVDISSIDIKKKCIVILCGNNSKSQRRAERYAYLCRSWLKDSQHKYGTTTYSIYYPNEQPLFNENPYFDLNYKDLAKNIFDQVIFKNNKIKTVDAIKRDLSNVVFFGHSAGGYVMNELMKNLSEMLSQVNFSKSDIKNIFESIVFIGYAPYKLVDAPIKSIYVAPIYDTIGSAKLVYKRMLKSKNPIISNPDLDILEDERLNERTTEKFLYRYKEKLCGENTVYYLDKNSMFATPNLLYYDGQKEDHNLAGAINYNNRNIYQTRAGKMTAKFLCDAFDYCLTSKRDELNIEDLYQQTIKMQNLTDISHNTINI